MRGREVRGIITRFSQCQRSSLTNSDHKMPIPALTVNDEIETFFRTIEPFETKQAGNK